MNAENRKEWLLGAVGLVVGCIGAFIESWDLRGDLDHRYPFKIMNVPPPDYYIEVSNTLASFAPYLAVFAGLLLLLILKRKKIIAGLIPVIVCPLTYVLGLWYLVSNSQYRNELHNPVNYDSSTAAMRHQEFYIGALNLLLFSGFVYLVFLALVYGINYWLNYKKIP
jgi:uncharacterized membrane protein